MKTPLSLSNKTVLITGAARRIGKALALACAQAGADLILHYHQSKTEAIALKQQIETEGVRVFLYQADLSQVEEVDALCHKVFAEHPIDILINNASLFKKLEREATTRQAMQEHLQINLLAPFMLIQHFLQHAASGTIINLLDHHILTPSWDHFPYSISKDALTSLTLAYAKSLPPAFAMYGIALPQLFANNDGAHGTLDLDTPLPKGLSQLEQLKQMTIAIASKRENPSETILFLR